MPVTSGAQAESVEWFDRVLKERGISGWEEPEPDLGIPTNPDYKCSKDGASAVCELKSFQTKGLTQLLSERPGRAMTVPEKVTYGPVRDAIKTAARQLKPLDGTGDPLIVVLANPGAADVSLEEPGEVIHAMYGNPGVQVTINNDTLAVVDEQLVCGRDGRLSRQHPYISAVATLHKRLHRSETEEAWAEKNKHLWETRTEGGDALRAYLDAVAPVQAEFAAIEGDDIFVRVFSTATAASGRAAELPQDFFEGSRDEYWAVDPATGTMERVR